MITRKKTDGTLIKTLKMPLETLPREMEITQQFLSLEIVHVYMGVQEVEERAQEGKEGKAKQKTEDVQVMGRQVPSMG